MKLDLNTFQTIVNENHAIINKAFQNQLIIPKFEEFCDDITDIYDKVFYISLYY